MSESSFKSDSQNKTTVGVTFNRNNPIPLSYHDNKIVLMVRDPWTLYSYWEVRREVEDRTREDIRKKGLIPEKSILRVYDVTDSSIKAVFDFELKNWIESWYVHTGNPGKKWMVDIGIVCTNGEFFTLARSNVVEAPPHGMSDVTDERWMCSEDLFYKMFAVAGGYGVGMSSMEMKEILERHLKEWLSSGGITASMFGSASLFIRGK